ncbi:aminotransferase [Clostridia bacterium]|nr:aminotransferase [Clostridia bacterium]
MQIRDDINFFDNRFLMFVLDQMANDLDDMSRPEDKVIRMTLGKSELPLHQDIIDEMEEALNDYAKYSLVFPAGLPSLKDRLSRYYSEHFHAEIDQKNFIISLGTSSIFRNLFELLVQTNDEVLLPIPYYSLYKFSALLVGADIRYYKINHKNNRLDIESFKRNFTDKTKIVVINTPGNPLGNVLSEDELYEIDRFVNGRAVIVNDEIYSNVYFDEPNRSVINLENTKSTFVTTNAFSKAYRMYSRRVGYCIVPDELIEPLTVIQHHTLLTVDPVVQFGAIKALEYQSEVKDLVRNYKERRNYTMKKMSSLSSVIPIYSQGGFYITLDCENHMRNHHISDSLTLAQDILNKVKVATVPGSDFGLPCTLRLSFSSSRYVEGIDRLTQYFGGA